MKILFVVLILIFPLITAGQNFVFDLEKFIWKSMDEKKYKDIKITEFTKNSSGRTDTIRMWKFNNDGAIQYELRNDLIGPLSSSTDGGPIRKNYSYNEDGLLIGESADNMTGLFKALFNVEYFYEGGKLTTERYEPSIYDKQKVAKVITYEYDQTGRPYIFRQFVTTSSADSKDLSTIEVHREYFYDEEGKMDRGEVKTNTTELKDGIKKIISENLIEYQFVYEGDTIREINGYMNKEYDFKFYYINLTYAANNQLIQTVESVRIKDEEMKGISLIEYDDSGNIAMIKSADKERFYSYE